MLFESESNGAGHGEKLGPEDLLVAQGVAYRERRAGPVDPIRLPSRRDWFP